MSWSVSQMQNADIAGVVALQSLCFPPPFDPELLWKAEHLDHHLAVFPRGQFVARLPDKTVIASCSNTIIGEANWQSHSNWDETVGGYFLETLDPNGTTLFGLDISVHPEWRGQGIAKALYKSRFDLVQQLELTRYGTACRIPDWHLSDLQVAEYVSAVERGERVDRTLTPLLRLGLRLIQVLENHMHDPESGNAACVLSN